MTNSSTLRNVSLHCNYYTNLVLFNNNDVYKCIHLLETETNTESKTEIS